MKIWVIALVAVAGGWIIGYLIESFRARPIRDAFERIDRTVNETFERMSHAANQTSERLANEYQQALDHHLDLTRRMVDERLKQLLNEKRNKN